MHDRPFGAERPASSTGGVGWWGVDGPVLDKKAIFMIVHKEKEVLTSLRSSEAHRGTT